MFARFLYGGRVSLTVGLFSSLIGMLIGVPLGLLAGFYRGWIETVIMRAADIFMSFPSIIFILVLVSVVGPSIWSVTLVIGFLGWTQFARLIYANVLSIRKRNTSNRPGRSAPRILSQFSAISCRTRLPPFWWRPRS